LAAGNEVVVLVRDLPKGSGLKDLGAIIHRGDVTDKESMRDGMKGADGIFHTAGWYKVGTRDKDLGEEVNVKGTRNVLELMRDLRIPRGVYTSTLAVFSDTHGKLVDESYRHNGPWLSEYDRTKWVAHYEVALPMIAQGLPLMIVQPGLTYGPGDTSQLRPLLLRYLEGKLTSIPAKSAYCWAHVDDTARGHLLAMGKGRTGESYIIAGEPHTMVETFKIAEKITGIPAPRREISPTIMQLMASASWLLEKIIPLPDTYTSESLHVLGGVTYLGSNEKAKRELGFTCRPLEDGLRETLEYEKQLLSKSH
jgi:nucleoside-diphosphate-sugar epimerase